MKLALFKINCTIKLNRIGQECMVLEYQLYNYTIPLFISTLYLNQ